MSTDSRQLKALRQWIEKSIPELQMDLGLKLWNGEVLALKDQGRTDICLCIRSPEAVRRLLFSPKLMTVFELFAESLLDIEGGTPLQAARRWDHIRMIGFARNMNKLQLLKTLSPSVKTVRLHPKAVLTPLGKEALRKRGITIDRGAKT